MKRKSRMFTGLRTWNPYFGCRHGCYRNGCWAKERLAHRIGMGINCVRCYSFDPHFHPERLKRIPPDPRIFVAAHADLFGAWVDSRIILQILGVCSNTPKETWFFETKNPSRYLEFKDFFPVNTVLSTTIETNRMYETSIRGITPIPAERFNAIKQLENRFPIHISIEPIMDFDLEVMAGWMERLQPKWISIGRDSLNNKLPEPSKEKTFKLIQEIEKFTKVERKQL